MTPAKQFFTCTFEEFASERLTSWRLHHKCQAIIKVYYPSGSVKEFALDRKTDVENTVKSILEYDPDIKILVIDSFRCMMVSAEPDDDGHSPNQKDPIPA